MKKLIFDIETIPDLDFGRDHLNLDGLSDEDIAKSMFFQQQQKKDNEFLPFDLHKIIAISVLIDNSDTITIESYKVDQSSDEKSIMIDFFNLMMGTDILISWNGEFFGIPVLNCRSLKNKVCNTYLTNNIEHIDLKYTLSNENNNGISSLDRFSKGLDLPGKRLASGKEIWDLYLNEKINEISDYCTEDLLNTYLIYLNYEIITGAITEEDFKKKYISLTDYLQSISNDALNTFGSKMKSI